MLTIDGKPVVWTKRSAAHRRDRGYSRRHLENIFNYPEHVVMNGDRRVVYGYGYGGILVKRKNQWAIIACFRDTPREGVYAAA